MGTEPLPLKGHRILNQGSSRGLSCTWLQDRYGARTPVEIHGYTVVCSHPPV